MPVRHSFTRAERLPVRVGRASSPTTAVAIPVTELGAAMSPNAGDGEP